MDRLNIVRLCEFLPFWHPNVTDDVLVQLLRLQGYQTRCDSLWIAARFDGSILIFIVIFSHKLRNLGFG